MKKRYAVVASLCLIVIVIGSLIGYVKMPKWTTADSQSILWQTRLAHFETGFTVGDEKVFITDAWAKLYCFDAQSGMSLWNASTGEGGGYGGGQVTVFNSKVYVAALGLVVNRFDENTGNIEMQYPVPNDYSTAYKMVPTFFIADQKMFAFDESTVAVYDLESGQILWSNYFRTGHTVYDAGKALPESNYTYVVYDSNTQASNGLDPNTGNTIWQYPGQVLDSPIVFQQQVILWNYIPEHIPGSHRIISINAKTGQELWHFDAGRIFSPTVYNGLLLFGAEDNDYYALNVFDGSLKWKTNVNCVLGSSPFIDEKNQVISWEILNTNSQNKYSATTLSLSLQDGSVISKPNLASIQAIFGQDNAVKLNNQLFTNLGNQVICVDINSGALSWERPFDHHASKPLLMDNKVFVAADLYLIAYK